MEKKDKSSARKKSSRRKIRFGVIGLGHIAQEAVLPAFRHAKRDVELTALISGDDKKLKVFGRRYQVPFLYSYGDFDRCLEESGVQALYIALPNRMHYEYALKALERGVHVLCEKPLALTEADCLALVRASRASGAKLMTAYRLHFDQANLKAVHHARKSLGHLRAFVSTFSYQIKDRENIRLEGADGGGPIWDIGTYCINAARYFFKEEPLSVSAQSVAGDRRFKEVPEALAVTMKFPQDRLASFFVSFGCGASAAYDVLGEKGRLHMENAYEYVEPREVTLTVGEKKKSFRFAKSDQFAPELVYFANCIRRNVEPEPSGLEGLADVRVVLAIEEAASTGKVVELGRPPVGVARKKRATLKQWIQRPAVRKPSTVHVSSPSA